MVKRQHILIQHCFVVKQEFNTQFPEEKTRSQPITHDREDSEGRHRLCLVSNDTRPKTLQEISLQILPNNLKKKNPPFQLNPTHQPWALLHRKLAAFPVSLQHCCEKASPGEIRLAHGAIRSITTLSRHICGQCYIYILSLYVSRWHSIFTMYIFATFTRKKKMLLFREQQ